MRDLIILSSGVHGEEMAEIAERINRVEPTWNLLGFIAAGPKDTRTERAGLPVWRDLSALKEYPYAMCVPDNEWPAASAVPRERLVSLVDPSVFVSKTA